MTSPLSTRLRTINRDNNKPLNILMANNHEAYSGTLAKTGHNFFILQHPKFHPWNNKEHSIPSNFFFLNGNNIPDQLKPNIVFDLILTQNRIDQYPIMSQLATQLNCPLLQMEHTLPWPDWNIQTIKNIGALKCDHNIFVADFSVKAWGHELNDPNVQVIRHGMDTDHWNGWVGGDNKVMTAVWDYIRRDRICGFSLWKEVTKGLQVNPWGETPNLSIMADNREHLRTLYRHASVFLNTTLWSSSPFSLLEAMSVGCPIVTTETTSTPEYIEDGVNGFMTNDPIIMREKLQLLIDEPELGRKIGEAGRKTVIERFGQKQFIDAWNSAFEKVITC